MSYKVSTKIFARRSSADGAYQSQKVANRFGSATQWLKRDELQLFYFRSKKSTSSQTSDLVLKASVP